MADVDSSGTQQRWMCWEEDTSAPGRRSIQSTTKRMKLLLRSALDEASQGDGQVLGNYAKYSEAKLEATNRSFEALNQALWEARQVSSDSKGRPLTEVRWVDGPWCWMENDDVPAMGVVIEFPYRWVVLCVSVGYIPPARWSVTQEGVSVCACESQASLPSLGADYAATRS